MGCRPCPAGGVARRQSQLDVVDASGGGVAVENQAVGHLPGAGARELDRGRVLRDGLARHECAVLDGDGGLGIVELSKDKPRARIGHGEVAVDDPDAAVNAPAST